LVEEVEVAAVEAFAGGWGVGVGSDAGDGGGAVEVVGACLAVGSLWGWGGLAGGVEGVAPLVGEHDAGCGVVGVIRVAFDAEGALVVSGVVEPAQGEEISGVGGSAVFPVVDVVDLQAGGAVAAGDGAAAVAVFDGASELSVDVAGLASGVERGAGGVVGDGADGGVAEEVAALVVGQGEAEVGHQLRAVGSGLEVEVHEVALGARSGCRSSGEGGFGERDEGIGTRHRLGCLTVGRLGLGLAAEVVVGGGEGLVDEGAFGFGEAQAGPPAVFVDAGGDLAALLAR
jgi:hypothetical protein